MESLIIYLIFLLISFGNIYWIAKKLQSKGIVEKIFSLIE